MEEVRIIERNFSILMRLKTVIAWFKKIYTNLSLIAVSLNQSPIKLFRILNWNCTTNKVRARLTLKGCCESAVLFVWEPSVWWMERRVAARRLSIWMCAHTWPFALAHTFTPADHQPERCAGEFELNGAWRHADTGMCKHHQHAICYFRFSTQHQRKLPRGKRPYCGKCRLFWESH